MNSTHETYNEDTLHKVYDALANVKIVGDQAWGAVNAMLNEGILFRERGEEKNPMQIAVETFMKACGQEVKESPGIPSEQVRDLRIRLMTEELLGSTKISGYHPDTHNPYVNPYHLINNKSDELVQSLLDGDIVGIADGLTDLLYVVIGTSAACGIDIQKTFDEVHRSNMTKAVWDDEKGAWAVLRDEGGKILKPDSFEPADLERVLDGQYPEI